MVTENRLVVARVRGWGCGKIGEGVKRFKKVETLFQIIV